MNRFAPFRWHKRCALRSDRLPSKTRSEPEPGIRAVERDPKDDVILATAVSARADALVTRDEHLLAMAAYRGIAILTPEAFVAILRQEAVAR